MEFGPDIVFRRMERKKRRVESAEARDTGRVVYVPQNVRAGSYRRLMQSHDRMGTRHLAKDRYI